MSDKNSLLDDFGTFAFFYTFWKQILVIAVILIVILVAGYYKFAAPVNKEHEENMSNYKLDQVWFYSASTGEKIIYKDINPMKVELANLIDDNGFIIPENKDRAEELSEELIKNILGKDYTIKAGIVDGKSCYEYYIGTIKMKNKHYLATFVEQIIVSKYKEDSNKEMNNN